MPAGLKTGANVRKAGEDVAAGETVLAAGAVLRPQDLAALASIGMAEVRCFKRVRVGIVSTGDEVVRVGGALQQGQVYDANAPMLSALVADAGAVASDLGVLPDNLAQVKQRLAEVAKQYDVIITTGGASRGEEDHLVAALDALGKRHMWQLAIKPGRPMSFGQIGDCVVLGLPGNPVAVLVCFLLYAWPMLRRLGGAEWREPRRYKLPAMFAFPNRKTGRREFWRGSLTETPRGLGGRQVRARRLGTDLGAEGGGRPDRHSRGCAGGEAGRPGGVHSVFGVRHRRAVAFRFRTAALVWKTRAMAVIPATSRRA